mmetsp:Transcript_12304/g.27567  ORF Transcript_12304/g.27567 Transcript_12304/m.27567 type:complete len:272 (-) Transcript_12304:2124-2939(-)
MESAPPTSCSGSTGRSAPYVPVLAPIEALDEDRDSASASVSSCTCPLIALMPNALLHRKPSAPREAPDQCNSSTSLGCDAHSSALSYLPKVRTAVQFGEACPYRTWCSMEATWKPCFRTRADSSFIRWSAVGTSLPWFLGVTNAIPSTKPRTRSGRSMNACVSTTGTPSQRASAPTRPTRLSPPSSSPRKSASHSASLTCSRGRTLEPVQKTEAAPFSAPDSSSNFRARMCVSKAEWVAPQSTAATLGRCRGSRAAAGLGLSPSLEATLNR